MWPRLGSTVFGIWLMLAPGVLGYSAPASTNDRIVGPLIASLAIIAITGAMRPVRRANTLLGAWLLLAPLVFGYAAAPAINSLVVGALVVALSSIRGKAEDRFGGGWSALWESGPHSG